MKLVSCEIYLQESENSRKCFVIIVKDVLFTIGPIGFYLSYLKLKLIFEKLKLIFYEKP